jgi:hypothetical protein
MPCYTDSMAKKVNRPKKSPGKIPARRLAAGQRAAPAQRLDNLYHHVRDILAAARNRAWQAVNSAMVQAYWDVGRAIVEEEQSGRERADYGKRVIDGLSQRLWQEFGRGYDRSNLFHMRAFFLTYPKVDALRRQLSWTPYRLLLRVDNPDARAFYEAEAVNARWSTRELERQIDSLLFDRLALCRDKAGGRPTGNSPASGACSCISDRSWPPAAPGLPSPLPADQTAANYPPAARPLWNARAYHIDRQRV